VAPASLVKGSAWSAAITIPAGGVLRREFEIQANQPGIFTVGVTVTVAGHSGSRIEAGALEVIEAPGRFASYKDALPLVVALIALVGSLFTGIVTILNQRKILEETRRQKAAESVSQLILQTARDYYGAISWAIGGLASSARRLKDATTEEREHLLARCFFFFGTVLHKDNEFSFSQGVLYLPDLWAESDMRRMIDSVIDLVPLTQSQEAVVHKCFF